MRYEYEREDNTSTKISYLLIGGGIGAILALLFAPKSGTELRGDIADATRKGLDKTKEAASQIQEKAGEYYEVSKEKAGELYAAAGEKASDLYAAAGEKAKDVADKAKEVAGDISSKAGELGEKAKDTASRTTNPISAAIEAGKDAYHDEKRRSENVLPSGSKTTHSNHQDKALGTGNKTDKV